MKLTRAVVFCVLTLVSLTGRALAQNEPIIVLPPDQLETLVSPIALYPDPLVALILPASTHPSDVVLAARYLANGGSPERVLSQPWEESVKALTRYREVVEYMDRNLDWTRRLGDSFIAQSNGVMDAIQAVRARARSSGLLVDTPQQEVVVESDEICIVPTNPTVIYVPRYDPVVLCGPSYPSYYAGSWLTFGVGYGIGPWLSYDCAWRDRYVRVNQRPTHWYYQPDWRHRSGQNSFTSTRWTPGPRHERRFEHREVGLARPFPTERRWNGPGESSWNTTRPAAPSTENRTEWRRNGNDFNRDRAPRSDYGARPRRENISPIATAPSVVATAPDVPTAPVIAAQPPATAPVSAPTFSAPRRFPRREPRNDSTPAYTPSQQPAVAPAPAYTPQNSDRRNPDAGPRHWRDNRGGGNRNDTPRVDTPRSDAPRSDNGHRGRWDRDASDRREQN